MSFDDLKEQHLDRTHQKQSNANSVIHKKTQAEEIAENNGDTFVKKGKILAHTINAPFTTIPFVPAATPILKKFDKATGQDLGFTYKASLSSEKNHQGGKDLIYKIDYIGFGIMSSKFNVQVAPFAAKIEAGQEVYKGFGCNASMLASPIGLIHERLGAKATITDCNSDSQSISAATEASYQKSSSFKPISTATYGYFFGNDASFRIPEKFIPIYNRIMANLPSWQESQIALEHIAPAIPFLMESNAISKGIEFSESALKQITAPLNKVDKKEPSLKTGTINIPTHEQNTSDFLQKVTSPSIKPDTSLAKAAAPASKISHEKSREPGFTVQIKPGDNLWKIAARITGDPFHYKTIAEMNQIKNPDMIFPTKNKSLIIPDLQKINTSGATYKVKQDETLEMIGKKTGHPWPEIYALNKHTLKNNPDKIQPGQELNIPSHHDHATLMKHPVVQARIKENIAKQSRQHTEQNHSLHE